jgi:hypothetical protein
LARGDQKGSKARVARQKSGRAFSLTSYLLIFGARKKPK